MQFQPNFQPTFLWTYPEACQSNSHTDVMKLDFRYLNLAERIRRVDSLFYLHQTITH